MAKSEREESESELVTSPSKFPKDFTYSIPTVGPLLPSFLSIYVVCVYIPTGSGTTKSKALSSLTNSIPFATRIDRRVC
jgi:hypothetical protein